MIAPCDWKLVSNVGVHCDENIHPSEVGAGGGDMEGVVLGMVYGVMNYLLVLCHWNLELEAPEAVASVQSVELVDLFGFAFDFSAKVDPLHTLCDAIHIGLHIGSAIDDLTASAFVRRRRPT